MVPVGTSIPLGESSSFSRGLSEAIPTEQARTRNCFPEGIIWRDPG